MNKLTISQQEELEAIIKEKSVDGRISCSAAWEIANSLDIPKQTVGEVIDRLNIRISKCQLGCF